MKKLRFTSVLTLAICLSAGSYAQKNIKEFVAKTDSEKIKKAILIDALSKPATGGSFKDGHGKTPYLSSKDQLPKKVALITFYITDESFTHVTKTDWFIYTDKHMLSDKGGNMVSNEIYKQSIGSLKEEFKKHGADLLTPEEYLDTEEKKTYYYKEFEPPVSKVGDFLSKIENRNSDVIVGADYFRPFGAFGDYQRSEALGYDLATKLGVDAVFGLYISLQHVSKSEVYIKSIMMGLHGPNPIPKEDKKYVGQKTGTGYYNGQEYVGGYYTFKNPFKTLDIDSKRSTITKMDFEGIDVIFDAFVERFYDEMYAAIDKVSN